jgi:DNA-binding IclR family transcriptional regulator
MTSVANLAVVKALATLALFTTEREWLGVREISRLLDLNTATVHNILRTLAGSHLVEQHPETKKYRLGLGLVKLAGTKLAQLDVVTAASGPMKELMERTRETITLSVLHGREAERLLSSPLPRYTPATVTDARKIRNELRQIREQDYAFDFGGYIAGVHAVAAPIRDASDRVVASIGIVAPAGRLPPGKVKTFAALARHTAARISTALGYSDSMHRLRDTG